MVAVCCDSSDSCAPAVHSDSLWPLRRRRQRQAASRLNLLNDLVGELLQRVDLLEEHVNFTWRTCLDEKLDDLLVASKDAVTRTRTSTASTKLSEDSVEFFAIHSDANEDINDDTIVPDSVHSQNIGERIDGKQNGEGCWRRTVCRARWPKM